MPNPVFIVDKQLANEIIGRINARDYTQQSGFIVLESNKKIVGTLYDFGKSHPTFDVIMKSLKTPDWVTEQLHRNVDDYKTEKVHVLCKTRGKEIIIAIAQMIFIE
jgi:hypothetical protein